MTEIRRGVPADIPGIAAIYGRILTEEEAGRASVGWIRGVYPTESDALEALEAGELFVLTEDGVLAAAARINQTQVPVYSQAPWAWPEAPAEQVMVLHTLVVDPLRKGRGHGAAFVDFYERYAWERGCPYLRMDTNEKNGPCTPAWVTGRRGLSPANSTASLVCGWCVWRRGWRDDPLRGVKDQGPPETAPRRKPRCRRD